MKSFKDKCIEAVDKLLDDYKDNMHVFDKASCSLCGIYWRWNIGDKNRTGFCYCTGCPNTAFLVREPDDKTLGCFRRSVDLSSTPSIYHLKFWRAAKKHLVTLDPKCFTPSKSKVSDFAGLLKIDRRVYKSAPFYKKTF